MERRPLWVWIFVGPGDTVELGDVDAETPSKLLEANGSNLIFYFFFKKKKEKYILK